MSSLQQEEGDDMEDLGARSHLLDSIKNGKPVGVNDEWVILLSTVVYAFLCFAYWLKILNRYDSSPALRRNRRSNVKDSRFHAAIRISIHHLPSTIREVDFQVFHCKMPNNEGLVA